MRGGVVLGGVLRSMADEMTSLRLIVLDGLDWAWCQSHRDLVPALYDLAEEGCSARLVACDAPITPTAVAALLAGRKVDVPWVMGDHYATSQEIIRTRPWVSELTRQGLTVGLCNVPLTWPAAPALAPRGSWVVAGFPVQAARNWHRPAGLDVLGYPIDRVICDTGPGGTKDVQGLADAESEIVRWVLESAPRCDLEVVWLRSTDGAGHHLWDTPEYGEVMARAAALIPRLREGAESVVVISDHGMAALGSEPTAAYMNTTHGPASQAAGLAGGHTMGGVLFAAGDSIHARGELADQSLVEVAGGLFDVLGVPPAPGMISNGPAWARAYSDPEGDVMRERLKALGYIT